jgi:hypothetical protein
MSCGLCLTGLPKQGITLWSRRQLSCLRPIAFGFFFEAFAG